MPWNSWAFLKGCLASARVRRAGRALRVECLEDRTTPAFLYPAGEFKAALPFVSGAFHQEAAPEGPVSPPGFVGQNPGPGPAPEAAPAFAAHSLPSAPVGPSFGPFSGPPFAFGPAAHSPAPEGGATAFTSVDMTSIARILEGSGHTGQGYAPAPNLVSSANPVISAFSAAGQDVAQLLSRGATVTVPGAAEPGPVDALFSSEPGQGPLLNFLLNRGQNDPLGDATQPAGNGPGREIADLLPMKGKILSLVATLFGKKDEPPAAQEAETQRGEETPWAAPEVLPDAGGETGETVPPPALAAGDAEAVVPE